MSLDVTLKQPMPAGTVVADYQPWMVDDAGNVIVYDANITHNLNKMAMEAEIYYPLWRPEEIGITKAAQLIPLLQAGLWKLKTERTAMERFNAPNGWGNWESFVRFVESYLQACRDYPEASIEISR